MRPNPAVRVALSAIRRRPVACASLFLCAAGFVAASLAPPWILRRVIDANLAARTAEGLPLLAAAYVAAIALAGILDFAKEAALTALGQDIVASLRARMMEKTARLPAGYYSKNASGATVSRIMNDVDAIGDLFTGGLVGMIVDSCSVVGIVVSLWLMGPPLGLASLTALPAIALVTRLFQRRMLWAQRENRVQTASMNARLGETIASAKTVKAYARERYMVRRYREIVARNFATIERINFYDAVFPCVIQLFRAACVAGIVILASGGGLALGVTAGSVAAAIELFSGLFAPIENIGSELQGLQSAVAGVSRAGEFLREPEDPPKDESITLASLGISGGGATIAFEGLSFSYDGSEPVIEGITLAVRPREKVSFAGRTGVGKTTLFRLVMGLLTPTAGRVTINGVDAGAIPNGLKKSIFGYVDQGLAIVDGTVGDQISLGDPDVGRGAILSAMRAVGLTEYVASLPDGIDTPIRNASLSQGQRQLVAIARAIVADPAILLLDEMTANLDSATERNVVAALERAGERRTILSISHRPSSMIASDAVVILENGRVRDSGTPAELAARDEWYRACVGSGTREWEPD